MNGSTIFKRAILLTVIKIMLGYNFSTGTVVHFELKNGIFAEPQANQNRIQCSGKHMAIVIQNLTVLGPSILAAEGNVLASIPTPLQINQAEVLQELKYKWNFKSKAEYGFSLTSVEDARRGLSAKLELHFGCFNTSQECGYETLCVDNGKTCLKRASGSECKCLEIPTREDNWGNSCSGAKYLGCSNADLQPGAVHINISTFLSPPVCIHICQVLGYSVAVLSGDTHGCYCQQQHVEITEQMRNDAADNKGCNQACRYDTDFSCGRFPYKEFYLTGIVEEQIDRHCSIICGNGTYCMRMLNSEFCVCDQNSTQKPVECFGCLDGWSSIVGQPNCFKVVNNISLLVNGQLDNHCQQIHGRTLVPRDLETVMRSLRITLGHLIDGGRHREMEQKIGDIVLRLGGDGTDLFSKGIPICERPKTPVMGKFPWASWPKGSYGIPMANTGCPEDRNFRWETGSYVQDTEDGENENEASNRMHLMGSINNRNITQHYCIKQDPRGQRDWPEGRYCIYKKGECPPKMTPSKIFWDDEDGNNTNKASGHLPDGMFKSDTLVFYCCMDAPLNPRGIELPREKPFYLFPFKSRECQHVLGTKSTSEYVQFDLENDFGWTADDTAFEEATAYGQITPVGKHLRLYYCYYEPVKICGTPLFGSKGIVYNQTEFNVGHQLKYTCPRGYFYQGDEYDVCLEEETWSSVNGAECVDINECASGNQHRHRCHRKANCYNTPGSYYCKCNPGWNGDGRTCELTKCVKPKMVANGNLILPSTRRFLENKRTLLRCHLGFMLLGNNVSVCQSNGEWTEFGVCTPQNECIVNSYKCNVTSHGSYCSCSKKTNKENQVGGEANGSDRWIMKYGIALTLVVLFIILCLGIGFVFRLKHRAQKLRKIRESSIYADINEFHLNYTERKPSNLSNMTSFSSSTVCTSPCPLPPARSNSMDNGISPSVPDHHRLKYRRHSDFGSSSLNAVNPRQFSQIFSNSHHSIPYTTSSRGGGENRHLNGTASAPWSATTTFSYKSTPASTSGRQLTQFKLHSLTDTMMRRQDHIHSNKNDSNSTSPQCPPPRWLTRPTSSSSFLENIIESTIPMYSSSPNNNDDEENPYIDVFPDLESDVDADDRDRDYDDVESVAIDCGHYQQMPSSRIKTESAIMEDDSCDNENQTRGVCGTSTPFNDVRSGVCMTGYEAAKKRYDDVLRREDRRKRSRSFPDYLSTVVANNHANNDNGNLLLDKKNAVDYFKFNKKGMTSSISSTSTTTAPMEDPSAAGETTPELPIKKTQTRLLLQRKISFKLKFRARSKNNTADVGGKKKLSFPDLLRWNFQITNNATPNTTTATDSEVRRFRAKTNPY